MSHERRPPAGYVECFRPDFALELRFPDPPELKREPRPDGAPLTDPQIVGCEDRFRTELAGARAGGAAGAP